VYSCSIGCDERVRVGFVFERRVEAGGDALAHGEVDAARTVDGQREFGRAAAAVRALLDDLEIPERFFGRQRAGCVFERLG
jgi:hypothetical protein